MNIIADTNILVRIVVADDKHQAALAQQVVRNAARVAIPTIVLCELNWVLSRLYKRPSAAIAASIRLLVEAKNVETDQAPVAAGLAMLDAGGDFADGVIAFEGKLLGGDAFVSFDKKAVKQLAAQGIAARLLA